MIIDRIIPNVATWQQWARGLCDVPTPNKMGNKQTLSSWIQDVSFKEFVKTVVHSSDMSSIPFSIQLEGLTFADEDVKSCKSLL